MPLSYTIAPNDCRRYVLKHFTKQQKLTASLFAVYCLALIWIIVFKFQLSLDTLPSQRSINLMPFYPGSNGRTSSFINDILYNMLVFIPYGIYICMLKRGWPFIKKVLPILLTSLVFEVVQYAFGIGASDVNDLLLNTLGGIIGIGIYYALQRMLGDRSYMVLNILALIATILMIVGLGLLSTVITYRF